MTLPDPAHLARLERTFDAAFGAPGARFLVRAPGRVNLIGDHVDYVGMPVLPIAIARAGWLLVRPRSDDVIRVTDCDERFGAREFTLAREIPPWPAGDWGNYVKASAQALWGNLGPLTGFDAALCSTVPPASGLSSSSSLVIASALALLAVNGREVEGSSLAEVLAQGERYVGTHGGGMDQAIITGARAGTAARISFAPLRLEHVRIPGEWRFVVAHSLVASQKAGPGRKEYNRRPKEAHEALLALTPWLDPPGVTWTYDRVLRATDPDRLLTLAAEHLPQTLERRFRHIITESLRVDAAVEAMQSNCPETFGELMTESHRSLRDDLEVSVPALDELVELGQQAGALGGRLTGAGLGGSAVFLVPTDAVESFRDELRERFYAPRGHVPEFDELCFAVTPSDGATVDALD